MQNTIRNPRIAKPTALAMATPIITPVFEWELLDAKGVEVADVVVDDCVGVAKSKCCCCVRLVRITAFAIVRVY